MFCSLGGQYFYHHPGATLLRIVFLFSSVLWMSKQSIVFLFSSVLWMSKQSILCLLLPFAKLLSIINLCRFISFHCSLLNGSGIYYWVSVLKLRGFVCSFTVRALVESISAVSQVRSREAREWSGGCWAGFPILLTHSVMQFVVEKSDCNGLSETSKMYW